MRISDWSSDVCSSDLRRGLAFGIERYDAIGARIADRIAEDGRTVGPRIAARQQFGHAVAVEDVIAKHEHGWFAVHKVSADSVCLDTRARLRLHGVLQRQSPMDPVATQGLEAATVLRGGYDNNPDHHHKPHAPTRKQKQTHA